MYTIGMAVQTGGLTIRDILTDIPHDGPALVVYALILIGGYVIWRGSRGGGGEPRG